MTAASGRPGDPAVSVVVATRDRAARLSALLAALARQTLPRERFEVVVVDDGSADGTPARLANGAVDVALRHERPRGPAAARNTGWRAARAPLVAFTDDDCRPEPGWLEAGLAAAAGAPGAIVQGRTRPEPAEEALLHESPRARSIRIDSLGPFFETCNIFYPRALLERAGGFDERILTPGSEDTDLALRAFEQGAAARFEPEALVNHEVSEPTLSDAVRFTRRWGTLAWLVGRHPSLRRHFPWRGRVWRESHGRLLLAVAGLGLGARRPIFLLWCLPYLSYRHGWRPRGLARSLAELPGVAAVDLAEVAVLVAASARNRVLFL